MTATTYQPGRITLSLDQLREASRALAVAMLAPSLFGILLGFLTLVKNGADFLSVPCLAIITLAFGAGAVATRVRSGEWPRDVVGVAGLGLVSTLLLLAAPEYLYGHHLNAIVHRSFFSTWLLLATSTAGTSVAIKRVMGNTPTAQDLARYVVIFIPIAIVLLAYGVVLVHLVDRGLEGLRWSAISSAYSQELGGTTLEQHAGLRNNIEGTFLLIGMTTALAILPGISAGVYMNEYPGRMAHVVRFSTTMLRAVAPFILGVAAFSLVQSVSGRGADDPISKLIRGSFSDQNGFTFALKGSFLTASAFLSVLIMPVIARATEEGLRSVPNDIREGSIALGATDGHGLLRLLLPWAMPNIITAIILGAAEVAGSVAVLLLIAGTGEHGVGPMKEATSLSFVIFETRYGPRPFQESMVQYQYTAALLLVFLTLGLTLIALLLKARLGKRYRGSLTTQ